MTKRLPYDDGEACCILDKGTLDALEGDEDKKAMLRECSRVLNSTRGVLLSISFGSVSRLQVCILNILSQPELGPSLGSTVQSERLSFDRTNHGARTVTDSTRASYPSSLMRFPRKGDCLGGRRAERTSSETRTP